MNFEYTQLRTKLYRSAELQSYVTTINVWEQTLETNCELSGRTALVNFPIYYVAT